MKEILLNWVILFIIPVLLFMVGYSFTMLSIAPFNPMVWQPFTRFLTFAWFIASGFAAFNGSS